MPIFTAIAAGVTALATGIGFGAAAAATIGGVARIVGAHVAVVADYCGAAADTGGALVRAGAGAAVVAGLGHGREHAAAEPEVAGVLGAQVAVVAGAGFGRVGAAAASIAGVVGARVAVAAVGGADVAQVHRMFERYPLNSGGLSAAQVTPNNVQGLHGLLSCAEWTGVKLSTLLDEAGIDPSAKWILAEGADSASVSRSIPLAKALDDCIVCLYQNGERIRPENGYPIRLLVPGYSGNMNIKWLRRIKLVDAPVMTKDETSKYTILLPTGKAWKFVFPAAVTAMPRSVQAETSMCAYQCPVWEIRRTEAGNRSMISRGIHSRCWITTRASKPSRRRWQIRVRRHPS